jgi:hypothetical protein
VSRQSGDSAHTHQKPASSPLIRSHTEYEKVSTAPGNRGFFFFWYWLQRHGGSMWPAHPHHSRPCCAISPLGRRCPHGRDRTLRELLPVCQAEAHNNHYRNQAHKELVQGKSMFWRPIRDCLADIYRLLN